MITLKLDDVLYIGENVSNHITVTVSEYLLSSQLVLEFETPSGDKFCSPILKIDAETKEAVYSIPDLLLSCRGYGTVQAVAIIGDYTEKSEIKSFKVNNAINAMETLPTDSPDLVRCLIGEVEEAKNWALSLDTIISTAIGSGVLV